MTGKLKTMTSADFKALFPQGISGNDINGLGVAENSLPKPFFWHPADKQPFHELQTAVIDYQRQIPEIAAAYSRDAPRGPRPIERAEDQQNRSPRQWSKAVKEFGAANEAGMIGITPLKPEYVYEGYEITLPNIILIAVPMNHDKYMQAPASLDNYTSALEVADGYNATARAARKLANMILGAGYSIKVFPGPMATALNMIPAAIEAGLGELGKHGNMINQEFGSNFRLSAIATDMPLAYDKRVEFGGDEFCMSCKVCTNACPPGAISDKKQMVRGTNKWYVDFDKCIPYFGEALSCGICMARCPWSKPGTSPKLVIKLAKRRARLAG